MTPRTRRHGESGVTVIELLVALAVFALFILMVDAVFLSANRASKKTELAADVQQNARIAVERMTREIRESSPGQILTGGSAGSMWVLFKSARLPADNSVFCLYVRQSTYNPDCFTFPGGNIPGPPYSGPPYPSPCDSQKLSPCGSYSPIWQRYVGYYVATGSGSVLELRRVTGQLDTPGTALSSSMLTGGDVVATFVETFDVAASGSTITATLKASGTQVVQGSAVPTQQTQLPGLVLLRN